ncbi:class II aldolase [Pseudoxanthomonas broegbernensis]|uniref:Class II aldolase n=1 Tax=Pseudoxanthomonas broegbernensis TaxID=83619 RepID=A0A7V8GKI3_9GAMM|nr:class II aldolase/adducin family protein [Pseudoxanthomonas broegbernensis]KAF1685100.1 class II aldolase [Pseudoxanthomonas broegbernensis]MBB6066237.1 HCOMODA/2-hydroxy-3-carboxy-muconic semialdehyde decarboxylase [Pseudoxanthomonas broegbernensis]
MSTDLEALARTVRVAARALGRAGLVHAYGHCSARIDAASFLVAPSRPLGLVQPGQACSVVPLDGPLPEGVLPEVRIHREIYRRRPDVGGVARVQAPKTMSLSVLGLTPVARHGFGAYFHPRPPLWDEPLLLRSDPQARQLAEQLGQARAIVMRGNGAVTAGESLQAAVVLAWYLEDAARVELDCLAAGPHTLPTCFTDEQSAVRATWNGRLLERMWDYLTAGDPETSG